MWYPWFYSCYWGFVYFLFFIFFNLARVINFTNFFWITFVSLIFSIVFLFLISFIYALCCFLTSVCFGFVLTFFFSFLEVDTLIIDLRSFLFSSINIQRHKFPCQHCIPQCWCAVFSFLSNSVWFLNFFWGFLFDLWVV